MPYPAACDRITPEYAKLVGANLLKGFRKTLYDAMGGVQGCSHVTELLAHLPAPLQFGCRTCFGVAQIHQV